MAGFARDLLDAAAKEREVRLTTMGRKTGRPHTVTIWVTTDGARLFIRSGGGMRRDWPQNLEARGEAELRLGGRKVKVRPRHVIEPNEARTVSGLAGKKYGFNIRPSAQDQPLTPGEQATFELLPAD